MSNSSSLIFPDLIYLDEYNGNFSVYFDNVYAIFNDHFLKSKPSFEGNKVTAPHYPLVDGRNRTFYHITHQGEDEQNRQPDLRRMERIRYPRFKIENHPHKELLIWVKNIGRDSRIHILNKEESYLVVLNKRNDYYMLWTAFYIEQNHTLKKKIKEYEAFKNAETA